MRAAVGRWLIRLGRRIGGGEAGGSVYINNVTVTADPDAEWFDRAMRRARAKGGVL